MTSSITIFEKKHPIWDVPKQIPEKMLQKANSTYKYMFSNSPFKTFIGCGREKMNNKDVATFP